MRERYSNASPAAHSAAPFAYNTVVLIAAALAAGLATIGIVHENTKSQKLEAWVMAKEFLPDVVSREGASAGDDIWRQGNLKFPPLDSAVITRIGDGFKVSSDFDIVFNDQKVRSHFSCLIRDLGTALLDDEAPLSMLPKPARNPKFNCGVSAGGGYKECHYYDFTNIEFSVRPIAGESRTWARLTKLKIDNVELRVGSPWDAIVDALKLYSIGAAYVRPDPAHPGSTAVHRQYSIDGKSYRIEFRRFEVPGPFRVFEIEQRLR